MARQQLSFGFSYGFTYVLAYFRGYFVVYKARYFVVSLHVAFATDVNHFCHSLCLRTAPRFQQCEPAPTAFTAGWHLFLAGQNRIKIRTTRFCLAQNQHLRSIPDINPTLASQLKIVATQPLWLVFTQQSIRFLMCGEHVNAKTDVCILDARSFLFKLLVQEDIFHIKPTTCTVGTFPTFYKIIVTSELDCRIRHIPRVPRNRNGGIKSRAPRSLL